MKKLVFTLIVLKGLNSIAQEQLEITTDQSSKSNLNLGLDVQSRYIWRGLQFGGNNPSLQPTLEFSYGKFTIGVWGAYSTGGVNVSQEVDVYFSYAVSDAFSLTVTDYFFPFEEAKHNYFDYGKSTGHVFEAMFSFSGIESFPIGVKLATNFGGAIKYNAGGSEKKGYSTYLEVNYSKKIADAEYSIFAGAVFADNNSYYLTDGTGFINLGISATKEIKITESFSLPVNTAFIFNPDQENIYLTFGFSL